MNEVDAATDAADCVDVPVGELSAEDDWDRELVCHEESHAEEGVAEADPKEDFMRQGQPVTTSIPKRRQVLTGRDKLLPTRRKLTAADDVVPGTRVEDEGAWLHETRRHPHGPGDDVVLLRQNEHLVLPRIVQGASHISGCCTQTSSLSSVGPALLPGTWSTFGLLRRTWGRHGIRRKLRIIYLWPSLRLRVGVRTHINAYPMLPFSLRGQTCRGRFVMLIDDRPG